MKKIQEIGKKWKQERETFLSRIDPEYHFFKVFDTLPNVYFYVKNEKGETIFATEDLAIHHGFSSESEMIGKTDHDLTPGPLAEEYIRDDMKIYATGEPLPPKFEPWIDNVGLPEWYRSCKYPVKDRSGKVIGIMGTLTPWGLTSTEQVFLKRFENAIRMLKSNLESFPPISDLARSCHFSIRQFQRLFKDTFRMSPRTYWMKLRIQEACRSLREKKETLIDIALRLGFWDQSSFSHHFKKHTGLTPMTYAKRH